jgi:hypothetical protein
VILFTEGSYSDFATAGLVVAIKECNLPLLVREFVRTYKPDPKHPLEKPSHDEFPPWLIVNGYVMPVDVSEVWLGGGDGWASEFRGKGE